MTCESIHTYKVLIYNPECLKFFFDFSDIPKRGDKFISYILLKTFIRNNKKKEPLRGNFHFQGLETTSVDFKAPSSFQSPIKTGETFFFRNFSIFTHLEVVQHLKRVKNVFVFSVEEDYRK